MHLKFAVLVLVSLFVLAACKPEDWKVLDQAEGHDALGGVLRSDIAYPISNANLPLEALVASASSSASQEPIVVVTPSSSAYVPPPEPPKEPCTEGQFRVYYCINGFREYI